MMRHQFTLHQYWRSSCSWRLRWALIWKDLSYRSVAVNLLLSEQRTDRFFKVNPAQTLPVLEIDGESFGESIALIEWLEEEYPNPPLLPIDPRGRLIVRQMSNMMASGVQPVQNLSVLTLLSSDAEERARWAKHWIKRGFEAYEKLLEIHAGTFSFGGDLSLADICLVPQVYNAYRFGVDMSHFPNIDRIYKHCLALPSCEKAHPDKQPGAN